MKKLVLIAMMVLGSASQARSIQPAVLHAELTEFFFQQGSFLDNARIEGGSVTIDRAEGELVVTLYRYSNCPKGAFCIMSMPAPVIYRMPILSQEVGACHEVVYTAEEDKRPVDGQRIEIKVTDHRTNLCEMVLPAPTMIQLTVDSFDRRFLTHEEHTILGEKLKPVHK